MPTISPKVQFPIPSAGVRANQTPLEVGADGLVSSDNWIYRNGRMVVRPGLDIATVGGISSYTNLIPSDGFASFEAGDVGILSDFDSVLMSDFTTKYFRDDIATAVWSVGGGGSHGTAAYRLYDGTPGSGYLWGVKVPISENTKYSGQFHISTGSTKTVYARMYAFESLDLGQSTPFLAISQGDYIAGATSFTNPVASTWTEVNCSVDLTGLTGTYNYIIIYISFQQSTLEALTKVDGFMYAKGPEGLDFVMPSDGPQPLLGTTDSRPVGLIQYDFTKSDKRTVLGTLDGWYRFTSNVWTDITDPADPLTATDPGEQVTFRVFNSADPDASDVAVNNLIGCNYKDSNKAWNGSASNYSEIERIDPATSLPFGDIDHREYVHSKTMSVAATRLLYGNLKLSPAGGGTLLEYPDGVIYTTFLTYDQWQHTNIVRLADTPGEITAMLEMGNQQTAIYKTDAIYMAISQGGKFPFRFEMRSANVVGPASPLSVVSLDDGTHAYLSKSGDVIIFDGHMPRTLGSHIQSYIKSVINYDEQDTVFGYYDKALKELYFFFTASGQSDMTRSIMIQMGTPSATLWPLSYGSSFSIGGPAILNVGRVFDEVDEKFSDQTLTWNGFQEFTAGTVLVDTTGLAYLSRGTDDEGLAISSSFQTGLARYSEISRYITLKEIDHLFDGTDGQEITVNLGTSIHGGPPQFEEDVVITIAREPLISRHRSTSRMYSIKYSAETLAALEYLGAEAAVAIRGPR